MYKELHISITTACTMKCPSCSYGMYWRNARHSTMEDVSRALGWFTGIDRISITGGEATSNPKFHEISEMVRNCFPKIKLGLETNATLYPRFKNSLRLFDSIDATLYEADAWEGCPDNSDKIELLKSDYPTLRVLKAKHLTMADNKGPNPCGRQARAHWSHGLVYGCCAGPGVPGAIGIELSDGWHEKLQQTRLPCEKCVFGQP